MTNLLRRMSNSVRRSLLLFSRVAWALLMLILALPAGGHAQNTTFVDPFGEPLLVTETANPPGASITTDTNLLATQGTVVTGASADGVTQVLVRADTSDYINCEFPDGSRSAVTFWVQDEAGNRTSTSDIGGLFAVLPYAALPRNATNTVTVTQTNTNQDYMAFAAYLVPTDFARSGSDDSLATRTIQVWMSCPGFIHGGLGVVGPGVVGPDAVGPSCVTTPQPGPGGTVLWCAPITILRPPVVLVHGAWADPPAWTNFRTFLLDSRFQTQLANYGDFAPGIQSTAPDYGIFLNLTRIKRSALGFAYNASFVLGQIRQRVKTFKYFNQAAAVQADVVVHSMGGNVTLTAAATLGNEFTSPDTYGEGPIEKLISIATPHLGSPLAVEDVSDQNECVREAAVFRGQAVVRSVIIGGKRVNGAVCDLQGSVDGKTLSAALQLLQQASIPFFPVAYIAGKSTPTMNWAFVGQLVGLKGGGLSTDGPIVRNLCGSEPLARALTPSGWQTLFNSTDNDSIVTVNSQLNGQVSGAGPSTNSNHTFDGVLHTEGLANLGFTGPDEQDTILQDSNLIPDIGTEVIDLLNEPKTGTDYHGWPQ